MTELYQVHAGPAVRLAYVLTGDQQLAEDLMQEAFVRVFGRFGERRVPEAFGRYLRATIVNLARSHWRRAALERDRNRVAGGVREFDDPDLAEREAIWAAVMSLPIRQRAALYFRYHQDLTEHEVAQALDCSESAARSLLTRARRNLEVRLKDVVHG